MIAPNIRKCIVAETDHYQLLDLIICFSLEFSAIQIGVETTRAQSKLVAWLKW